MRIRFPLILMAAAATLLAGCETTSTRPYTASTENVMRMQSILGDVVRLKLGNFTENEENIKLTCRLSGPVDVSPGKTNAEYIRDALQSELFLAKAYDLDAATELSGTLNALSFSSTSPASWDIDFSIQSNNSTGYNIKSNYPFKTSFSAYSACQNVADAFAPAVQTAH